MDVNTGEGAVSPSRAVAPSRAFTVAAALGLASALPAAIYTLLNVVDTLLHSSPSVMWSNVAGWLAIGGTGPLAVIASTVRMMRRADRPVAVFVVTLLLPVVPTLLFMGLLTFGSDGFGLMLLCFAGLLSGVAAAVTAVVAKLAARRS